MYLLQGFHLANILVCYKVAFPKGVGLLSALSVDGVFAVFEPVEESLTDNISFIFLSV